MPRINSAPNHWAEDLGRFDFGYPVADTAQLNIAKRRCLPSVAALGFTVLGQHADSVRMAGSGALFAPDNNGISSSASTRNETFAQDAIGLEHDGFLRCQNGTETMPEAITHSHQATALAGPRNLYKSELSGIKVGSFAGFLLIDGNPLDDSVGATRPSQTLHLIMKSSVIHKNALVN
ncbi:hypothetical protein [Thalassovita sp.]|uniref:hypothetical protein n=1 Tax=Thalassovita sp. TaxID=1979401 RepID=UPI0029DE8BA6|nr:hypothetical protein [Thalassovita sp.]